MLIIKVIIEYINLCKCLVQQFCYNYLRYKFCKEIRQIIKVSIPYSNMSIKTRKKLLKHNLLI